jgi:hypothetical protein
MASLQRYSSHGITYYRIVESYRRPGGKPTVRVLFHLGKAEDLLARLRRGSGPPWGCVPSLPGPPTPPSAWPRNSLAPRRLTRRLLPKGAAYADGTA